MFGEKVGGNKGELITRLEPHMSKAAVQRLKEYESTQLKVRAARIVALASTAQTACARPHATVQRTPPLPAPCAHEQKVRLHDLTAVLLWRCPSYAVQIAQLRELGNPRDIKGTTCFELEVKLAHAGVPVPGSSQIASRPATANEPSAAHHQAAAEVRAPPACHPRCV